MNTKGQTPKPLTEKRGRQILKKLDLNMKETEMFLKQDLTITDVAQEVNEHPKAISSALNTYYRKNFNTYVNEYRIQAAEALLKEGYTHTRSIEGLSREVGFRSKTSFYRSFREKTGMTPAEFVKKYNA